ncbi:hypothetical protein HUG15_00360 [Salicibibacter cibarius]|uniref:Uncharacterized protein n=1 Tax=Salicibibacter cibarius TaxID=2743000 RepID=A0A7T6YZJ5_9BACI|nr:hypothetical protein [Salicibibacter cibarius]QQK74221.1 hypothetical protein HUG15_00360 [Salicibibacter cibarius]
MSEYKEISDQLEAAKNQRDFTAVVALSNKLKQLTPARPADMPTDDLEAAKQQAAEVGDFAEVVRLSNALIDRKEAQGDEI